ncbi:hypothetical protein [Marilutibacter aestuarii]|uniref:Uncharacterized protein n=1 Tax=Marilutibacter aestuarii TaxID=1706195 RepID=A0A508AKM6_9GAMM|nr:hypothetical protein [Lysobacter aestuarii]TQD47665.1 hypothetical protein FKV25_05485 [Lysobacter aestuarii]
MFEVKTVFLSRSEVHALVWSMPMPQAASSIGISDVGLAKVCKRYDVTRPPQGYWLKKEPRPAPVPLSLDKFGRDDRIEFRIQPARNSTVVDFLPAVSEKSTQIRQDWKSACPKAREARRVLGSGIEDKGILVPPRGSKVLDIRVSKDQLDRAVLLFDALIRATQEMGGTWRVAERETKLEAMGGTVTIDVIEHRKQTIGTNEWGFGGKCMTLVPTGDLRVRIGRDYGVGPAVLRDTPSEPMESKVLGASRALIEACLVAKQRRDHWNERQRQIDERRAKKLSVLVEAERAKILRQRLCEAAALHEQARSIRSFCGAIEERLAEGAQRQHVSREWLAWALQEADLLDPLRGDEELPIDMEVEPSLLAHVKLGLHD